MSVDRQNGAVPAGVTMACMLPSESVVDLTVAAPSGATCRGVQPQQPSGKRVSRSRAPALMQTVDVLVYAELWVMATVPDGQPAGTGVVGMAVSVGVGVPLVMRTAVPAGPVGLGCWTVTDVRPPTPGADAPGVAQDTAATDTSTHAAASRAPVPLSGPISDRRSIMAGIRHEL